jgi:hypothetical protein
MDYELVMNHNGEEIYPIEEEIETIASEMEDYKPSTSYSSVDEEAVYLFMEQAYDEITNYGENYVPEIHDSQVAE